MMRPDANVAVFVCVTPVDMRKQAATLALIVEQTLKRNIFEPGLYVFSGIVTAYACGASGSKAGIGSSFRDKSRATRPAVLIVAGQSSVRRITWCSIRPA
jgi:hypothetical protein